MRIGYARVSTAEQNLDLQLDALKKAECKRIYEEHASGKNSARVELQSCLKALRADDVLIVWRLGRLGRSLPDLVRIAGELEHRNVGLESITEKIETVQLHAGRGEPDARCGAFPVDRTPRRRPGQNDGRGSG